MVNNTEPATIVVIDSGIEISKSDLSKYVMHSTGFRVNNEGYISEMNDLEVENCHGTAIALVIRQLCKNVNLISINILNHRLTTDTRILITALEHAIKFDPDIVHLSLGTTRLRYRLSLYSAVRHLIQKNVKVVAAVNNYNIKTYPAYFKGVIRVDHDQTLSGNRIKYCNNVFYAPGTIGNISGADEVENNGECGGSSMAAAYVTGHLAGFIFENKSLTAGESIDKLKRLAASQSNL